MASVAGKTGLLNASVKDSIIAFTSKDNVDAVQRNRFILLSSVSCVSRFLSYSTLEQAVMEWMLANIISVAY